MDRTGTVSSAFNMAASTYGEFSSIQNCIALDLASLLETEKFKCTLDVGCGTGRMYNILKKHIDGTYIQLDISEEMCKQATTSNQRPTIVADMNTLPFKSNSFDMLVSSMAVHWTENLSKTLSQFCNVLRPGGTLLISCPLPGTMTELHSILSTLYGYQSSFYAMNDLLNFFKRAGVFIVESCKKNYTEHYRCFREFCIHMKKTGVFAFNRDMPPRTFNPFVISRLYSKNHLFNESIPVSWEIAYIKCIKV